MFVKGVALRMLESLLIKVLWLLNVIRATMITVREPFL